MAASLRNSRLLHRLLLWDARTSVPGRSGSEWRAKSTVAAVKKREPASEDAVASQDAIRYQRDPLDLTFSNTKEAYKSKTTGELTRALLVLKLSSYAFLINNHKRVREVKRSQSC